MNEPDQENYWKDSELLDSDVYLEELSDVLCIAQAELPSLLPITEVAEALLHLPNGTWLLCRLVANAPDAFHKGLLMCLCFRESIFILNYDLIVIFTQNLPLLNNFKYLTKVLFFKNIDPITYILYF